MLKIYINGRHLMDIVQYGNIVKNGKMLLFNPVPDRYAIPGGFVASENQIREWARPLGFRVKRCY